MARAVLVVLSLLAIAFAGCTSSTDSAADDELAPIVHNAPDDAGNVSAEESKRRAHLHDYWGGVDEFVVFDETFSGTCYCGSGAPMFRFEPPGGAVFPQGTRWVNVTVAWQDNDAATYTDPRLFVETAADHEPREVGPIENGATVSLEVDANASDLPHELLSNWAFEVRVSPENPTGLWHWQGEGSISATAARGHPIVLFPPHPELWDGATEIVLFEEFEEAEPVYYGNPDDGQGGSNWLGPHVPTDGVVVPYDAARITVEVEYDDAAAFPFTLGFHGADTREWTLLEPDEEAEGRAFYEIPLGRGMPDGPYAAQSHWVFEVWADEEDPPVFTGGYTIRAVVHKEAA